MEHKQDLIVETPFLGLASPDIRDEDIAAVAEVLKSGMLVQGKEVAKFEAAVSDFIGVKHAICVANGTATMHLSLVAMGIGPEDEVIVPAFSYIATANVVELVGATPVFVDIDLKTFNIDVNSIEAVITSKTKAIIPVHEFGLAADIFRIKEIAQKHNLLLLEDAACALGATDKGQFTGSFGLAGSFSLHPRKAVTSGEGGIITTNNDDLANKLRVLRNHGIEMRAGEMDFVAAGFNYRLTDFQAALVNSQFKRLPDTLYYKKNLASIYFNELNTDRIILPTVPEGKEHTWQTFHVILQDDVDRATLIANLRTVGIGTNYGAQCISAQTFYVNKYGGNAEINYPNAYRAYTKGLAIPIYEKLTKEQIAFIANKINKFV